MCLVFWVVLLFVVRLFFLLLLLLLLLCRALLDEMPANGLKPDKVSFSSAMQVRCLGGCTDAYVALLLLLWLLLLVVGGGGGIVSCWWWCLLLFLGVVDVGVGVVGWLLFYVVLSLVLVLVLDLVLDLVFVVLVFVLALVLVIFGCSPALAFARRGLRAGETIKNVPGSLANALTLFPFL